MSETYLIKNHIVNINSTNHLKIKSNVKDLKTYIDKIRILGGKVIQLDKNIIAVELRDITTIVSEKQIYLGKFTDNIFDEALFKSIDLSEVNTSKSEDMFGLFMGARAKEIKGLDLIDTSRVMFMHCMFYRVNLKTLDLSKFNTSNLRFTNSMFQDSRIDTLNLNNLDFSTLEAATSMFENCRIKTLKINRLNIGKRVTVHKMFKDSEIETIIAPDEVLKTIDEIKKSDEDKG